MNHELDTRKVQRAVYLLRLARALYNSAVHEEDRGRLELHRHVAVELAGLVDEAINNDGTLHPDLGLDLLLFIELKASGNDEAATDQKYVGKMLESLETVYHEKD